VIFEKRIAKKVIDERIKSGQICPPPLVLSVGKKGLVLEGLRREEPECTKLGVDKM